MIKFRNAVFSYGGKRILDGLSLDMASPRVCVTGPSGCGKTTLLRLAAGLETPESGEISRDFSRPAVMFQEDRLLPWLTAEENVAAALPKGRRGEAAGFLEAAGLSGAEKKLPRELSGGMARRVSLARALAFGGDALLLDEPFKGADPELTRRLAELILAQGVPFVAVLHSEEESRLLKAEVLRFSGPPLRIYGDSSFTFSDSDDKIR